MPTPPIVRDGELEAVADGFPLAEGVDEEDLEEVIAVLGEGAAGAVVVDFARRQREVVHGREIGAAGAAPVGGHTVGAACADHEGCGGERLRAAIGQLELGQDGGVAGRVVGGEGQRLRQAQAGLDRHVDAVADKLPLGGHGFVDNLEEVQPLLDKDARLRVGIGFPGSQGNVCSQLEVLDFPTLEIRTAGSPPPGAQMIKEQGLGAVVAHGKGGGDYVQCACGCRGRHRERRDDREGRRRAGCSRGSGGQGDKQRQGKRDHHGKQEVGLGDDWFAHSIHPSTSEFFAK